MFGAASALANLTKGWVNAVEALPAFNGICDSMAILDFQSLLTQYQAGERRFHNIKVDAADGFECDLREIELVDAIITTAYLPYSNLSRANLQGLMVKQGNLGDAKFSNSNLERAQLSGLNLSRADFRYACLREANLRDCNLSGADLTGADLTRADLSGAELTGANLAETGLQETRLLGATLFRAVNVDVAQAQCDRTTILPDGHYYP